MNTSLTPLRAFVRRRPSRRSAVGLVAFVAVAGLGAASTQGFQAFADAELAVSPGDRVLQSVDVTMGSDGSLTAVEGTTVTASADGDDAESVTDAFAPEDVVDDLPVRVLTSYRTDDGSGSDLSDLEGYTGRVAIDMTVQNLTVEPQRVTYDADGASRSQSALVGAPLTIVAATSLGDTPASAVVTEAPADQDATNGVLSQTADGTTQVQWASILAPPQLRSSATLSLVADVEDFAAPTFDLSVQPGLVTDPSLGALVTAAFNPASSEELALQSRTIEVIGDVNDVLGRASDSIVEVRSTLEASSETLGTKTVGDLRSSIARIASSMKALDGTVTGLGASLSTTLEATGNSSLAQLRETLDQVDTLLGDTGATAPTAIVRARGCGSSVRVPAGGASVYSNLLRVVGTLRGYARTTALCRGELQQEIIDSIGPADPFQGGCDTPSVTCSLAETQEDFDVIATKLAADGKAAVDALDSDSIEVAVRAADELQGEVDAIGTALGELVGIFPTNGVVDLSDVRARMAAVRTTRQGFVDAVAGIRTTAQAQVAALGSATQAGSTQAQNAALAAELCGLVGDGATANTLTADQVEDLRSYLVTETCPAADGSTSPLAPRHGTPMSERLDAASAAWTSVATAADPADTSAGLGKALADFDAAYVALRQAVDAVESGADSDSGTLRDSLRRLSVAFESARRTRAKLGEATSDLQADQDRARSDVQVALDSAVDRTRRQFEQSIDPAIRTISERAARNREQVGEMFDASRAGLSASARDIAADGRATLNGQRAKLKDTRVGAERAVSQQIQQGLEVIAAGVSRSTADTDAAATLLTSDLTKVLLDLGDPQVPGAGLLGSLTANAATAGTADYQLALASRTATAYANVRSEDIAGLLLRQAQAEASFQRQADLPAFQVDVPDGVEHRTVYSFHLQGGQ